MELIGIAIAIVVGVIVGLAVPSILDRREVRYQRETFDDLAKPDSLTSEARTLENALGFERTYWMQGIQTQEDYEREVAEIREQIQDLKVRGKYYV